MTIPRVFVSHATSDSRFADNLSQDLKQLGADVWLDSSHLGAGDFVARINDALRRSDVFVLVLTPAALASQWVQQEMNAAITREKQGMLRALFVVEAQPCTLSAIPPLWTVYNRYDASSDYSTALYGIARKMGLQVPRAATRTAVESSTSARQFPLSDSYGYDPIPASRGDLTPSPVSTRSSPAYRFTFTASICPVAAILYLLVVSDAFNLPPPGTVFGQGVASVVAYGALLLVLASPVAWLSSLAVTLRLRNADWALGVLGSAALGALSLWFELHSWGAGGHVRLVICSLLMIGSLLLPLRIGLVGLGPKREK